MALSTLRATRSLIILAQFRKYRRHHLHRRPELQQNGKNNQVYFNPALAVPIEVDTGAKYDTLKVIVPPELLPVG